MEIAAAYQKLIGIAPTEIESAVQAQADYASLVSRESAKAKDPTATLPAPEMSKIAAAQKKFEAASDPINTWVDAYCKPLAGSPMAMFNVWESKT